MIRRYGTGLRALLMLTDIVVASALAILLSRVMFQGESATIWGRVLPSPRLGLLLYACTWVAIVWALGLYRVRARWSMASDAWNTFRATLGLGLATFAFLYVERLPNVSRLYLLVLLGSLFVVTVTERAMLRWAFNVARRRGRNARYVLVLGTGPLAIEFARKLEDHAELGLRIAGFLGDPSPELPTKWAHLGSLDDLTHVMHERVVDELAICLMSEDWRLAEEIVRLCETEGKIARMPIPMPVLTIATSHVEDLDGMPVMSILTNSVPALALAFKRILDVVAAGAGTILLAPLFAGIGLAILRTDGRPIFFRQERVGVNGRRFEVLKFRTMVREAETRLAELKARNEVRGHAFKLTHDPRVTRVGAFLRRSSLDELPQLWNVLRGDMSLVGPRPPLPSEVAEYDLWHRRRLSMKPGITGLWQIEGRRDGEFDRWVEKDLEYIDHWSTWLDIQILLRTIPAVLRAEGR